MPPASMRNLKRYRPVAIVLVAALLLLLTARMTASPDRQVSWLERSVSEAVYPFQVVADWLTGGLRGVGAGTAELFHLSRDNVQLRAEAKQIPQLQSRVAELEAENTDLRKKVGLPASTADKLVAAQVIGRYPESWFNTIIISRGSSDGIGVNMAVQDERGLVGKVVRVSAHSAVVQLLIEPTNPRELGVTGSGSGIGAMDQTTREPGLVFGLGDRQRLKLTFFNRDAKVEVGDPVVTSYLSVDIPGGLAIGKVESVGSEQNNLVRVATVVPSVDFNHLEYVFVNLSKGSTGGSRP